MVAFLVILAKKVAARGVFIEPGTGSVCDGVANLLVVLAARDARTGQLQAAAVVVRVALVVEHIAVLCTQGKQGTC